MVVMIFTRTTIIYVEIYGSILYSNYTSTTLIWSYNILEEDYDCNYIYNNNIELYGRNHIQYVFMYWRNKKRR